MKIEHIAIWVSDLEKMKSFYEEYFNGTAGDKYYNPSKKFTSYFISFESGCRLELMHRPDISHSESDSEKEYLGITHLAFSLGSREQVDQMTRLLDVAGYKIVGLPRETGDGYYESVVLDPENNRIEITA